MPRAISADKVRIIAPIIERVDAQLELAQSDRYDFEIKCADKDGAKQIKQWMETYKQNNRPAWKGSFIMRIRDFLLRFEFNSLSPVHFQFVDKLTGSEFTFVQKPDTTYVGDPVMQDLTDTEAAQRIIMEFPAVLVLNPIFLSTETRTYFDSPGTVESTALGRIVTRQGYNWKVFPSKIRLFQPNQPDA